MTSEAYDALAKLAARKIEREWACNGSERAILLLVAELSYGMEQSYACIPCLGDFVVPTGYNKSTISRSVRSAVRKKYLITAQYGDQMLYMVATGTKGAGAPPDARARELAIERLREIQRRRLRGQADADGQMRMPGFFANEETDAPAAAFEALMEQSIAETAAESCPQPERPPEASAPAQPVPRGTNLVRPETPAPAPAAGTAEETDPDPDPDADIQRRLERIVAAAGGIDPQLGTLDAAKPAAPPGPARKADQESQERRFRDLTRGMKGDALHAMSRIYEECLSRDRVQVEDFLKWGGRWKRDVAKFPHVYLEAAGMHKAMRLERRITADAPGALIHNLAKELLGNQVPAG